MHTDSLLQLAEAMADRFSAPGLVVLGTSPARHGILIAPDLVVTASNSTAPTGVIVTASTPEGDRSSSVDHVALKLADITVLRLKSPIEGLPVAEMATEKDVRKKGAKFIGLGWENAGEDTQDTIASTLVFILMQANNADLSRKVREALFKGGDGHPGIQQGDRGSPVYVHTTEGWKLAGIWNGGGGAYQPASLLFPWENTVAALSP